MTEMTDTKVRYRGGYEQKEREEEMRENKRIKFLEMLWGCYYDRFTPSDKDKAMFTELRGIVEKYPIAVKLIDQLKATPKETPENEVPPKPKLAVKREEIDDIYQSIRFMDAGYDVRNEIEGWLKSIGIEVTE